MRWLWLGLLVFGCAGDGGGARTYDNNDLQLLTGYSAKDLCSCIFVMERDEEFCRAWAKASPNLKTVRVDYDKGEVQTQAVLFWGARARYLGGRGGCQLE